MAIVYLCKVELLYFIANPNLKELMLEKTTTVRKYRKTEEQTLQIACINYLNYLNSLNKNEPIFYFKIDNEGKRSVVAGSLAKRMGLRAGMMDIGILYKQRTYFVEFKAKDGKLSKQQEIVKAQLQAMGFTVKVINNIDDFITFINEIKL